MLKLNGMQGKTVIVDGSSVTIIRDKINDKQETTILIRNISSVEVKQLGFLAEGHIRFITGQRKQSFLRAMDRPQIDENAVLFKDKTLYSMALDMKKYIEEYKTESPSVANISAADEILKLKVLMDDGIITLEEFNAKKKQLLGI